MVCATASAQEGAAVQLRFGGVMPGGVRKTATESWGAYDLNVTNVTDKDQSARILVSYTDRMDDQYGRDVWVPAHATLSTWMLVGPAPVKRSGPSADIQILLRDPSESAENLVFTPGRDSRHSRAVLFRHRDPSTTVMIDDVPQEMEFGRLPQPESLAEEAQSLVRTLRQARELSEHITTMDAATLPPAVEAFDGTDLLVLASGRVMDDPVGMRILRHWLQQGGKLWVMLDRIDPRGLAPVLGDALDFELVDRVSLVAFQIDTLLHGVASSPPLIQQHERPVEFARVLLPAQEHARQTVDGWPAWFTRQVGRGKVFFTTLGARAWFRPRTRRDAPSPYELYPTLPVPLEPLQLLANEVYPAPEPNPFRVAAFQPMLTEEIGYSVVSRGTLGLVFAAVLAVTLALAIRRKKDEGGRRKDEKGKVRVSVPSFILHPSSFPIGLVGPAAALGATCVLVAMAELSRREVPATVAVAQFVDVVPGAEEVPVHGLLAVYRPDSGSAEAGAEQGGFFELDVSGLAGKTRRFLLTDMDAWHWENLALPAGVRTAPFNYTAPMAAPIAAVARFGPGGLEGRLAAGSFHDLADLLLSIPDGRHIAVRLRPDGTFSAGNQDILPKGQFLASGVLSDRQQQRQTLYRQFLSRSAAGRTESRTALLAWAQPIDMHFALLPDARTIGNALLTIPLRLERSAPGERVTIPGPFVSCRRLLDNALIQPTWELSEAVDMRFRFQLPASVLPLKAERARLSLKIDAPGRRVTVLAGRAEALVELHSIESPLDPIRVDISDERWLQLDADGGLQLNLKLSGMLEGGKPKDNAFGQDKWTIEYLELEVTGRMKEEE